VEFTGTLLQRPTALTAARAVVLPPTRAAGATVQTGLWRNRYGDWANLVMITADSYDSEGADGARYHLHRHLDEIAEALAVPPQKGPVR
jgi:hypothetical protein